MYAQTLIEGVLGHLGETLLVEGEGDFRPMGWVDLDASLPVVGLVFSFNNLAAEANAELSSQ